MPRLNKLGGASASCRRDAGGVLPSHDSQVRDALRGATLDALLERHPRAQQLEQLEQELRGLRSRLHTLSGRDRGLGESVA